MTEKITHKRGDTFKINVSLTEDDNITPINITGWTIRSQVRKRSMLVEELVSAITDATNGEYSLTAEDTTEWLLGILVMDIEYTDTLGFIHSTETFEIDVLKDVTYD